MNSYFLKNNNQELCILLTNSFENITESWMKVANKGSFREKTSKLSIFETFFLKQKRRSATKVI